MDWMQASDGEFKHRASIFGILFGVSFPLYAVDPENCTVAVAHWLTNRWPGDPDTIARALFVAAVVVMAVAAWLRTWASAYLDAGVVYAAAVKSASLVADGPYRRVRNPLYCANVLLMVAMGSLMSRLGFVVAAAGMILFCYRLIFREEAGMRAAQGSAYENYCRAVPRLWPAVLPRIAGAGRRPDWFAGFKAESWCWGFAAALTAFAVTLDVRYFYGMIAASLVLFWVGSRRTRGRD